MFFRTSHERIHLSAQDRDDNTESIEHIRDILHKTNQHEQDTQELPYEKKLIRIDEGIRSLIDEDIPALRMEIEALRRLVSSEREH